MSNVNELLNEIYARLDRKNLVKDLNPKSCSSSKGEYHEIDCPKCLHKGAAFIYANGKQIICNRKQNCASSISIWDYLKETKSLTNQETLEHLAALANFSLPRLDDESMQRMSRSMEKYKLLDAIMAFFVTQLWSERGIEARNYLVSRGYSEKDIEKMGIGFNPSGKEAIECLKSQGYDEHMLNSFLKYLEYRDDYPIVFPYRDFSGRIADIWGRTVSKVVNKDKYKPYTTNASKSIPFCLDIARGIKELIVVEGFFDAMIAIARGYKGVVAIGSSCLSESNIEAILKNGSSRIFLALDSDEAGLVGTEKSIKLLFKANLECYVVPFPESYKDPDEFITRHGIDCFKSLIKNAQNGSKWLAKRIIEKFDTKTDVGRKKAIKEIFECYNFIIDPVDRYDFLNFAANLLDIPSNLLHPSLEEASKEKSAQKFKDECAMLFKQGSQFLEEGNLEALDKLIKSAKPDLSSSASPYIIQPYTLQKLEKDLLESKEGLKTGYSELDAIVRIPHEAITLVGGRPSHGKTTFLLNLLLNVVRNYPDRSFYFFSYEETSQQIALKILNILSGEVFNEASNLLQLEGYLKSKATSKKSIENAKSLYHELITSGRLNIIGSAHYVHELTAQIAYLKAKGSLGAVFIDYIQKIKNKAKFSSRQLELQNTSECILEAAKSYSVPIILGAQLGRDRESRDKVKLDNLREAGDLEQDANLVLGLFNPVMEKALDESNQIVTSRVVELKVTPLKNRNGLVNKTVALDFDRPTLTIRDKKR